MFNYFQQIILRSNTSENLNLFKPVPPHRWTRNVTDGNSTFDDENRKKPLWSIVDENPMLADASFPFNQKKGLVAEPILASNPDSDDSPAVLSENANSSEFNSSLSKNESELEVTIQPSMRVQDQTKKKGSAITTLWNHRRESTSKFNPVPTNSSGLVMIENDAKVTIPISKESDGGLHRTSTRLRNQRDDEQSSRLTGSKPIEDKHQDLPQQTVRDFENRLRPRLSERLQSIPYNRKEKKLVIGQIRVDVVPSVPLKVPKTIIANPTSPSVKTQENRSSIRSMLRFGLGQL